MRDNAVTSRNTPCCVPFLRCTPPKVPGVDFLPTDGNLRFGPSLAEKREISLYPSDGDHKRLETEYVEAEYLIPLPRPQDRPPDKLSAMRYSLLLVRGTILWDPVSRNSNPTCHHQTGTGSNHATNPITSLKPSVRGKTTFLRNPLGCVAIWSCLPQDAHFVCRQC